MIGKRMRHIGRYHEIAVALLRHGFGMIVDELGFFVFSFLCRRDGERSKGKRKEKRLGSGSALCLRSSARRS
ncbi:hypothetical protein LR69_02272 [Geobacillus sp. BCO2]|nr:hypothetical protein LR69_02272 [Geobacillus sp. BCO2]